MLIWEIYLAGFMACSDDVKEEVWKQYIENNINYYDKKW